MFDLFGDSASVIHQVVSQEVARRAVPVERQGERRWTTQFGDQEGQQWDGPHFRPELRPRPRARLAEVDVEAAGDERPPRRPQRRPFLARLRARFAELEAVSDGRSPSRRSPSPEAAAASASAVVTGAIAEAAAAAAAPEQAIAEDGYYVKHPRRSGMFCLLPYVSIGGKPVYKCDDAFLFHVDAFGEWKVGSDYNSGKGWLKGGGADIANIKVWQTATGPGKSWEDAPYVTVDWREMTFKADQSAEAKEEKVEVETFHIGEEQDDYPFHTGYDLLGGFDHHVAMPDCTVRVMGAMSGSLLAEVQCDPGKTVMELRALIKASADSVPADALKFLHECRVLEDFECLSSIPQEEEGTITLSAVVDCWQNYVADLQHKDPQVRIRALRCLADLDVDGICFAKHVNALLRDWNPHVRMEAAAALGKLSFAVQRSQSI